jgi:hypothetical protein
MVEGVEHDGLGLEFPGQPLDILNEFCEYFAAPIDVLGLYLIEDHYHFLVQGLLLSVGHMFEDSLVGLEPEGGGIEQD